MKNTLNKIAAGVSVLPVLLLPAAAFAQTGALKGLGSAATSISTGQAGTTTPLPTLISNLINVILGVMGIVFVVIIVYAGILYMNAGANPDNAKKAKTIIINAIIGIILVMAAYAISNFLIGSLIGAVKP